MLCSVSCFNLVLQFYDICFNLVLQFYDNCFLFRVTICLMMHHKWCESLQIIILIVGISCAYTPVTIMNPVNDGAFPSLSNFVQQRYGGVGKQHFRAYQKTEHLLIETPLKTRFLRRCLAEGIIPPFARIQRKENPVFNQRISSCETQIVKLAIRDNYRLIHTYESESRRLRTWIKENFSPRDYYNLLGFVNRTSQTAYQKKSDNLFKKFSHLHFKYKQKNAIRPQGSQSSSKPKVGRVLINLSDRPLSDCEKSLLEKGLGYAIFYRKGFPTKKLK